MLSEGEISDLPRVQDYIRNLDQSKECDIILLSWPVATLEGARDLCWSFAGIDVGCFESEWSHFSVILNEIIFGVHDELRAFAERLNENLLLPTLEDVLPLLNER